MSPALYVVLGSAVGGISSLPILFVNADLKNEI